MADSIRRFDSKTNRTADSIRDSIRTKKNDSQVPNVNMIEGQFWAKSVVSGGVGYRISNPVVLCSATLCEKNRMLFLNNQRGGMTCLLCDQCTAITGVLCWVDIAWMISLHASLLRRMEVAVLPPSAHKLPAICSLLAGVCAESGEQMLIMVVMPGLGRLFVFWCSASGRHRVFASVVFTL